MLKFLNFVLLTLNEAKEINNKHKKVIQELKNCYKKNIDNKKIEKFLNDNETSIFLFYYFLLFSMLEKNKKLEEENKKLKSDNKLLKEKILLLEKKLKKQENINKEIYKIIKEQEEYIKNNCKNNKNPHGNSEEEEKVVSIIQLKKQINNNFKNTKF